MKLAPGGFSLEVVLCQYGQWPVRGTESAKGRRVRLGGQGRPQLTTLGSTFDHSLATWLPSVSAYFLGLLLQFFRDSLVW